MDSGSFGRLERVPLRKAWMREDTEFTPWLAQPENLTLLGEAIGIELELEAQEQNVGPFRADLLCKSTADGAMVLVENQIERTDHSHLGQVITYAAGLDAVTVVWIAARFTEEHRAALNWLNEVSHENIRFFGLEVELWRIGQSPAAPKFNVIAQPNDWSKTVRDAVSGRATTEHQIFRREFWAAFCAYLEEVDGAISGRRSPSRDHWMTWAIGRGGFQLDAEVGFRDGWIGAKLVIIEEDGHQSFDALRAQDADIVARLGEQVDWDLEPNRKQNYARLRRLGVDPMDRAQWPDLHRWLREKLEALDRVFRPLVAKLGTTGNTNSGLP